MMMSAPNSLAPAGSSPAPSAAIAAELARARSILLLTHENPDGDAIGSVLALHAALLSLGKTVNCAFLQNCPDKYRFLPGSEAAGTSLPHADRDCAIALDCDGETRLGALREAFRAAPTTINIDHHEAECAFAGINWCDASKAATGLMIHELLGVLGVPISQGIATCLYTAIATDTGFFRFRNTSPEALEVCGQLIAAGADPAQIARQTSEQMPAAKAMLLGRALSSLQISANGAIVLAALTQEDFAQAGALAEHTDGIIDELKRIQGVEIMILLREQAPDDWRASLRSTNTDVAAICRRLGGGGHRLAAGCEMQGADHEVTQRIIADATAALGVAVDT